MNWNVKISALAITFSDEELKHRGTIILTKSRVLSENCYRHPFTFFRLAQLRLNQSTVPSTIFKMSRVCDFSLIFSPWICKGKHPLSNARQNYCTLQESFPPKRTPSDFARLFFFYLKKESVPRLKIKCIGKSSANKIRNFPLKENHTHYTFAKNPLDLRKGFFFLSLIQWMSCLTSNCKYWTAPLYYFISSTVERELKANIGPNISKQFFAHWQFCRISPAAWASSLVLVSLPSDWRWRSPATGAPASSSSCWRSPGRGHSRRGSSWSGWRRGSRSRWLGTRSRSRTWTGIMRAHYS